ncbi:aldo/keto reductase [Rhodococcus sp. BP-252]|uniref:aldo/keto reductase n=1 Tax=unclassified Rhodococcus (in: high G+C Gram-positive bacteria) TaxID=192944 RepID=UPI001C9BA52A|nr:MULTISPECIES: aldo/keto reductase [unclassified Rhodococcus (in: high G+C Gram-positive bacteria)]MBY6413863.1 aldo/keto reductase [Rhodococcus sp. BP-320]MBY6419435.1 aldo/keto reductase [Rhodococcus sp. BP-321]MBY6424453.1 aldo/keto reductase [Rhodococcus sp. BP-324]MBY6428564.1 aldo/keto reductase [Rhodococcus sp. BP-323]MBY6434463.1 aldo/keto reductase [Rhodococcus sp. BP-322]
MTPTFTLADGTSLPAVGLGTVKADGEDMTATVGSALDAGYRLIDTALRYETEGGVGDAVRASSVSRDDILVTTKIPGRYHGYDEAKESVRLSLANLGLEQIDLLLIHWPLPKVDKYVDTWRSMIDMQKDGLVKSIGVSNFTEAHLDRIAQETGVLPVVNQVELHPYFPQADLRSYHAEHGIVTESWSPLGRGSELLKLAPIADAAAAHDVSAGQVVLRWHHQLGAVPLPKSSNPDRQRQNLDIFGFELTDAEVSAISSLERGRIWDQDPDTYEEF